MHLNRIIGLMFGWFFRSDGRVVADLARVTESPREETNEYASLSTYDVTPAQHPVSSACL